MEVGRLWRYPVKSMAGETIERTVLGRLGVPGDRLVYVVDGRGQTLSGRTRPRLLRHQGTLGRDGEPQIDGVAWDTPLAAAAVRHAAGEDARCVPASGAERFDILPLLVATDGAIAAFGEDARRLRPNLVVTGVPALAERGWEGQLLRVGAALVGVASLRQRCVVTTWDPETGEQDVGVLRRIQRDFGGRLALNAWVVEPGPVEVGDPVEVVGPVAADSADDLPFGRFVTAAG
jgi:uncharacterized protein YcbX